MPFLLTDSVYWYLTKHNNGHLKIGYLKSLEIMLNKSLQVLQCRLFWLMWKSTIELHRSLQGENVVRSQHQRCDCIIKSKVGTAGFESRRKGPWAKGSQGKTRTHFRSGENPEVGYLLRPAWEYALCHTMLVRWLGIVTQ